MSDASAGRIHERVNFERESATQGSTHRPFG